jgi:hypothetical protein
MGAYAVGMLYIPPIKSLLRTFFAREIKPLLPWNANCFTRSKGDLAVGALGLLL